MSSSTSPLLKNAYVYCFCHRRTHSLVLKTLSVVLRSKKCVALWLFTLLTFSVVFQGTVDESCSSDDSGLGIKEAFATLAVWLAERKILYSNVVCPGRS